MRTLRRWEAREDFQAERDRAYAALTKHVDARLRALTTEATNVLGAILERDDRPELQLRAALGILNYHLRIRPFEIEQRLENLERSTRGIDDTVRAVDLHILRQLTE